MMSLILIGYWHSEEEPHWPDPARFVDPTWDSDIRETVARHLEGGHVLAVAAGVSPCRFRCREQFVGCAELTDGSYYWPEGLAHYVRQHEVRLPDAFVEHVLRAPGVYSWPDDDAEADHEWWRGQKGCGPDERMPPG